MPTLYFDADYVYENSVVLLPIFPFSLGNFERQGEIPPCIDLTMISGDNTKCFETLRLKEFIFK